MGQGGACDQINGPQYQRAHALFILCLEYTDVSTFFVCFVNSHLRVFFPLIFLENGRKGWGWG